MMDDNEVVASLSAAPETPGLRLSNSLVRRRMILLRRAARRFAEAFAKALREGTAS